MKKLIIYQNGKRMVLDRLLITEHGNPILKEVNLDHATEKEFFSLKQNPHNDLLLAEIAKKGIR